MRQDLKFWEIRKYLKNLKIELWHDTSWWPVPLPVKKYLTILIKDYAQADIKVLRSSSFLHGFLFWSKYLVQQYFTRDVLCATLHKRWSVLLRVSSVIKCDQICMSKSIMENFIFCAVLVCDYLYSSARKNFPQNLLFYQNSARLF